jgi:hypothetical protein
MSAPSLMLECAPHLEMQMRRARRPGRKGRGQILDASLSGSVSPADSLRESLILAHQAEIILPMMTIILAIVLLLWLIGVLTAYTLGGLIHLLLLLALIVLLIDILDRRKVL